MANQGKLENAVNSAEKLDRKKNHEFYLGRLAVNKKYFDKVIKYSGPKCPFYESEKKIHSNMKHIIAAMDVAEVRNVNIFKRINYF